MSTVSTQSTTMRTEGPYQGPTAPSFPEQMYPQAARVTRTVSVATTSTAAVVERPYEGPVGPTHPYAMYPQGITPDAQENLPVAPIPVGFPGLNNQQYQRRIGPEGEDAADIIGPDGHTEQLPPYTQYPEEALARKVQAAATLSALAVGAGAGGLGLATRNPEYDSPRDSSRDEATQSPLLQPDRGSVISRGSGSSQQSHQTAATATVPINEKKEELKHWQIVATRKVCGIVPIWGFGLMAATILVMVAILAGVLTALKPKHRDEGMAGPGPSAQQDTSGTSTVYQTVTTTFDAKSTPVPSSFPILPSGTYQVMLGSPQDTQTDCIMNSAQLSAWSCQAPPPPISIDVTSDKTGKHTATLTRGQNLDSFNYGTQPPVIEAQKKLDLVIDVNNPSYGPAWFFQVPYDKLVVLHENQLSISTSSEGKRDASFNPSSKHFHRRGPAQPGDTPWFCYWNGTLLETFIFANQRSAAGAEQPSSTSRPMTSPTTESPSSIAIATALPTSLRRQPTSEGHSSEPANVSEVPLFLSGYPKIVKIEERRIPPGDVTVRPFCTSMTILSDGTPLPNLNSSGMPIEVEINEADPSLSEMSEKRGPYAQPPGRTAPLVARDISGDCSCTWIAT